MIPESPSLTASPPARIVAILNAVADEIISEDEGYIGLPAEDAGALRSLSAHLPEMIRDGERLDALEREANAEPILLHSGGFIPQRRFHRGLGLVGTNRTIRNAIDQAFARSRPLGETK